MAEGNGKKEFLCNVSLIKALLQFFPMAERGRIQEWLKRLHEVEDGTQEAKSRNEYTFYLLFNLQNGTLSMPFNKPPCSAKLKPLCKILPDIVYEEVQKQLKVSYCRLNRMLSTNTDNYEMPDLRCEPSNFKCEQPRPRKGVSAALVVFSNYDD